MIKPPGIFVRPERDVPHYVADLCEKFAVRARHFIELRHHVNLDIIFLPALELERNGDYVFGRFYEADDENDCLIQIAGDMRWRVRRLGRKRVFHDMRKTIAHELCHYEQFRDQIRVPLEKEEECARLMEEIYVQKIMSLKIPRF